jgi:hypothetical protein
MKIIRNYIPNIPLDAFADEHGLVMEIHERRYPDDSRFSHLRYYAHFSNFEVCEGLTLLITMAGNGATPEEAMADYAKKISLRQAVVGAVTGGPRREIVVPRLSPPSLCERHVKS